MDTLRRMARGIQHGDMCLHLGPSPNSAGGSKLADPAPVVLGQGPWADSLTSRNCFRLRLLGQWTIVVVGLVASVCAANDVKSRHMLN